MRMYEHLSSDRSFRLYVLTGFRVICTSSTLNCFKILDSAPTKLSIKLSLTLFRRSGFWGPRQLWRYITSWWLKLSPPNLATFPENLLGTFWHLHHVITNFDVPWQPVFDSHVFQFLHFLVLINVISMVYGVICSF